MSRRAAAILWLVVGGAVWLGFFDLYVSRGAREYLQTQAEFELGRGPRPSMDGVMARAQSDGVVAASWLGGVVTLSGWTTIALIRKRGQVLNSSMRETPVSK